MVNMMPVVKHSVSDADFTFSVSIRRSVLLIISYYQNVFLIPVSRWVLSTMQVIVRSWPILILQIGVRYVAHLSFDSRIASTKLAWYKASVDDVEVQTLSNVKSQEH